MVTLSINIPDSLFISMGGSLQEVTLETQFLLAMKLFEMGRISSGQASVMCGMDRISFIIKAGKARIPVVDLDESELQAEIENA